MEEKEIPSEEKARMAAGTLLKRKGYENIEEWTRLDGRDKGLVALSPEGVLVFVEVRLLPLGSDGFGPSDVLPEKRAAFEADAFHWIAVHADEITDCQCRFDMIDIIPVGSSGKGMARHVINAIGQACDKVA